jgi:parallel beta-helix repeat protein
VAFAVGAHDNALQGNFIGINIKQEPLGNAGSGVEITGASHNTIGAPGAGNAISGNHGAGVVIVNSSTANLVQGNRIGTNVAGDRPSATSAAA